MYWSLSLISVPIWMLFEVIQAQMWIWRVDHRLNRGWFFVFIVFEFWKHSVLKHKWSNLPNLERVRINDGTCNPKIGILSNYLLIFSYVISFFCHLGLLYHHWCLKKVVTKMDLDFWTQLCIPNRNNSVSLWAIEAHAQESAAPAPTLWHEVVQKQVWMTTA